MPDIDSLSIRISSDASAAISGLDSLASTLERISRISSSATGSLSGTSKSVSSMRSAVAGINKTMVGLTKGVSGAVTALTYIPKKLSAPFVKAVGKMGSAVMGLGRQIARVAMYRALRSAIKLITQAFSEGITNLYKWSSVFDKTFYKAMNTIATAKTYFSNSMAAMASPLIEAFAPVIDAVIDKFVEMFNIVNQFLSRIVGKDTYTAARKVKQVWDDVDEDTDNTTQKVKELRKALLGFDEINRLDKETSESTSGNSNKKPPDTSYLYMFEERPIDGAIASFADKIKEAIQGADWEGLGTLLGDKFNDIIDMIDFAGLGKKLGNSINAVFETLYWFLVTADFSKVGNGIATFLNNAVGTINFNMIGRTLVRWFTSGVDALIAFLMEFDFGQLAVGLSDFVIGICNEIYDWFDSYEDWESIGETIGYNIADAIASIKYGEVWDALTKAINIAVESIIKAVTGAVTGISNRFKEAMNWDELPEDVKKTILAIEALAGIAGFAVGAVLTFSGANIGLGLALMVASGLLLAVAYEEKWGDLKKKVDSHITEIKFFLSTMGFAVGAVLAFGGFNIPLGIGLMVASGALGKHALDDRFEDIKKDIDSRIGALGSVLLAEAALLAVGALLTFVVGGKMLLPGIAMMIAGGVAIGYTIYQNRNFISEEIKRIVKENADTIIKVNAALLVLGVLLMMTGSVGFYIGLGMVASSITAFCVAQSVDEELIKNRITELVDKNRWSIIGAAGVAVVLGTLLLFVPATFGIGLAMLASGIGAFYLAISTSGDKLKRELLSAILANIDLITKYSAGLAVVGLLVMIAGAFGIGLAMLSIGCAGLFTAMQLDPQSMVDSLTSVFENNMDIIIKVAAIAVGVGIILLFIPATFLIGVALIVGGIGAFVAAAAIAPDTLNNKISEYVQPALNWLKNKAKLVLGIFAMIGGNINAGITAVVEGVKGLWAEGTQHWNELVELGKKAIEKVQEGWNKAKDFTVNIKANVEKKLQEILAWLGVNVDDSIQNTPNNYGYTPNYGDHGGVGGTGRDHNVVMKMSATAGNGFKYNTSGQLRPNIPDNMGIGVTLGPTYTDTGERVRYSMPLNALGLSNLKTNVGVGVNPVWKLITNGFMLFMGLLGLKTTIDVNTSTAWSKANKNFLNYLDVVNKNTTVNVNLARGNWKNGLHSWIGNTTHTVTVNLTRGNWYWGLSDWIGQEVWVRVNLYAGGGIVYSNGYIAGFAGGGVITRSGWNHLDKAANGGHKPHGTMFVAGEAGPEIVGHIGGRTEVLNKSQLASTMFASVSSAISPAVKAFVSMGTLFAQAANEAMNTSIYTMDRAYAKIDAFAGSTAATENATAENMMEMLEVMRMNADAALEQNRLLQQQNDLLRQINEKDYNLDISTAAINKAQQRSNRRAGVTVVSVGG